MTPGAFRSIVWFETYCWYFVVFLKQSKVSIERLIDLLKTVQGVYREIDWSSKLSFL